MLRNLVTSLFEHEQIKTTLPKARDTARLAEKIITLGKRGDRVAQSRASAFLLKPNTLTKLFGTFAQRYADRPGGYTRIHKFGNRKGDNASHAVLELVDNPRDLRWEMTSRAVGWEVLRDKLRNQRPEAIINIGGKGTQDIIEREKRLEFGEEGGILRPKTRWNLQKILKYRDSAASGEFSQKAAEYVDHLLATPVAFKAIHDEMVKKNPQTLPPRPRAGQKQPGETRRVLDLARGKLGHSRSPPKGHILTMKSAFRPKPKVAAESQ